MSFEELGPKLNYHALARGFKYVLPCGDDGFNGQGSSYRCGAGFDGSGEPLESVRDLELCSRQWPESDDLGIGGAFVASGAFAGQVVPSIARSTTLMRTSRSCATTGAASANSMAGSIRRI